MQSEKHIWADPRIVEKVREGDRDGSAEIAQVRFDREIRRALTSDFPGGPFAL